MPSAQQRLERAQRARANGAKSRGPKTAAGLHRARTASIKNGLYTTSVSGICPESNEAFLPFHAKLLADLAPKTAQAERLANQLITVLWDAQVLQNGYIIYMSSLVDTLAATSPYADDPAKLIIEAQKLAMSTYGGTVDRFQARISACNRARHRIQRELLRLEKTRPTSGPSQKSLKTQTPPEIANSGHEKHRCTSGPSQKSLKTGTSPNTANIQPQPAKIPDSRHENSAIQADRPRSH